MDGELTLINKYLKKHLTFIIRVSSYELRPKSYNTSEILTLCIYVSPSHFCELFFNPDCERNVNKLIKDEFSTMLKSIIGWDGEQLKLIFCPEFEETLVDIIKKDVSLS